MHSVASECFVIAFRGLQLSRGWASDIIFYSDKSANNPLERTGHRFLSVAPVQAPCLPLRGSVIQIEFQYPLTEQVKWKN